MTSTTCHIQHPWFNTSSTRKRKISPNNERDDDQQAVVPPKRGRYDHSKAHSALERGFSNMTLLNPQAHTHSSPARPSTSTFSPLTPNSQNIPSYHTPLYPDGYSEVDVVDVTELPYECKSSSILPACAPSSAAGPLLTDIANMPMERPNGIFEVDEPSFNGAAQDTAWEDVDMQMDDAYADEDDDSDDEITVTELVISPAFLERIKKQPSLDLPDLNRRPEGALILYRPPEYVKPTDIDHDEEENATCTTTNTPIERVDDGDAMEVEP